RSASFRNCPSRNEQTRGATRGRERPRFWADHPAQNPLARQSPGDLGGRSRPRVHSPDEFPEERSIMKPYIPKQPRQTRERIEAKLDAQLARKLESYCEFLESDRDYVVTQALELVFRKDKEFVEWLGSR